MRLPAIWLSELQKKLDGLLVLYRGFIIRGHRSAFVENGAVPLLALATTSFFASDERMLRLPAAAPALAAAAAVATPKGNKVTLASAAGKAFHGEPSRRPRQGEVAGATAGAAKEHQQKETTRRHHRHCRRRCKSSSKTNPSPPRPHCLLAKSWTSFASNAVIFGIKSSPL